MLIIPAIDLVGGSCVRLMQGRFEDATDYGDPLVRLRQFADAGATWVHVVDLDGARLRRPAQLELIGRLAGETGLNLQSGGGLRARADVEALLDAGVTRAVIGSAAARSPEMAREWIAAFGVERICVALDVRRVGESWEVVADGWTTKSGLGLAEALALFPLGALRHALVTDVSRDGALSGPNVSLMQEIAKSRSDIALQASGGVSTLSDLSQLKQAGASAAIVGRALYERRFTLEEALAI